MDIKSTTNLALSSQFNVMYENYSLSLQKRNKISKKQAPAILYFLNALGVSNSGNRLRKYSIIDKKWHYLVIQSMI